MHASYTYPLNPTPPWCLWNHPSSLIFHCPIFHEDTTTIGHPRLGRVGPNSNMVLENAYRNHCRSFILHWTFVIWELPGYVDKIEPQTIQQNYVEECWKRVQEKTFVRSGEESARKKQQAHRDQAASLGLYAISKPGLYYYLLGSTPECNSAIAWVPHLGVSCSSL